MNSEIVGFYRDYTSECLQDFLNIICDNPLKYQAGI